MKNLMIAAVAALTLASAPAMAFTPAIGPAIQAMGILALGAQSTQAAPACANEPMRKVAWKSNPDGYSFTVAGCDYQAKKDKFVLK